MISVKLKKRTDCLKLGAVCTVCQLMRTFDVELTGLIRIPFKVIREGQTMEIEIPGTYTGCDNPSDCDNAK